MNNESKLLKSFSSQNNTKISNYIETTILITVIGATIIDTISNIGKANSIVEAVLGSIPIIAVGVFIVTIFKSITKVHTLDFYTETIVINGTKINIEDIASVVTEIYVGARSYNRILHIKTSTTEYTIRLTEVMERYAKIYCDEHHIKYRKN